MPAGACGLWTADAYASEMHAMMPHGDGREAGLEVVEVTHWQTGRAVVGDTVLDVGLPRIPWAMTPGGVRVLLGLLDETGNITTRYRH